MHVRLAMDGETQQPTDAGPATTWKAKYRVREEKRADDGGRVCLLQDAHDGSWCVGKVGDPRFDPFPLAAFQSRDGARRYADQVFPGGSWSTAA